MHRCVEINEIKSKAQLFMGWGLHYEYMGIDEGRSMDEIEVDAGKKIGK